MTRLLPLLLATGLTLALAGCGQKGSLYLPDQAQKSSPEQGR